MGLGLDTDTRMPAMMHDHERPSIDERAGVGDDPREFAAGGPGPGCRPPFERVPGPCAANLMLLYQGLRPGMRPVAMAWGRIVPNAMRPGLVGSPPG